MRSGPLLAETRLTEFRPLGALGEPAYLAYARLTAALESLGAADCARYFARPERDERRQSLAWHAPLEGPVRRWSALGPEEQGAAAPRILAIKQRLAQLAGASEAGGAQDSFARLLRQAAVAPGLDHLFLVGDQPVLTAWGFESDTTRFDTLVFANPAARAEAVAADPRRVWAWLWRWWWLPLALLLLLALLLGLWAWWPEWGGLTPKTERTHPPAASSEAPAAPAATMETPPAASDGAAGAGSAAAPLASPSRSGEILTIPERGIDFLEGTWRTDSAIVDRRDGKPLVQTFTFNRTGEGEVRTRRSDGVECRGRARAERTPGGGVVIYGTERAACSDGDFFVPFRLECAPGAGGISDCRGVNADDGSGYEVGVRRLGTRP